MNILSSKTKTANFLLAFVSPVLFLFLLEIAGSFYMCVRHTLHEHEIRIESQGILENNKTPGEKRLFVIGESAVEGVPFTMDHSMTAFLSQLAASGPGKTKVINLGMQGKHSFYQREYGKSLVKYKADGVILYAGNNDTMPESNVMRDIPLARLDLWLTYSSQFYFGLKRRILWFKNLMNQKLGRALFDANPYQDQIWTAGEGFKKMQARYEADPELGRKKFALGIRRYEENLEHLVRFLNKKGIKVWIMELPMVHGMTPQLSFQVRGGHPEKTKALRRIAKRQRVPFIPLQDLFEKLSDTGLVGRNFFLDECHPNFYGHKIIAARMMEALCADGFISCPTPYRAEHFLEKLAGKQDRRNLAREYFLVGFYQFQGTVWNSEPQYPDAVAYFQKALSLSPSYADVYPFLAVSYSRLGDSPKAHEVMLRLQALDREAYQKALYDFPDLRKV